LCDANCQIKSSYPAIKAVGRLFLFSEYLCFALDDGVFEDGQDASQENDGSAKKPQAIKRSLSKK
jgi:hypothetical protein